MSYKHYKEAYEDGFAEGYGIGVDEAKFNMLHILSISKRKQKGMEINIAKLAELFDEVMKK